jgi:NTE family protein
MTNNQLKVDAVFEGGGVKGIGFVGAVEVMEAANYQFENVAGTSAGAIVASFIAADYSAGEMTSIMEELDYTKFRDKGILDRIPLAGPLLSLGFEKGIYEGDYFEEWLRDHLAAKGVETFANLVMEEHKEDPTYRYRLQVIAADISLGELLVLPGDISKYGIEPDALDVARAVRMSMSIPIFFEPVMLQDTSGETSYIVDGGLLSNYPVWIFDDGTDDPPWPTFGFKLVEPDEQEARPRPIRGPLSLVGALLSTMMDAHDARYIADKDFVRTVPIPTLGVQATDFDLSGERSRALFESGKTAAQQFLEQWDFDRYKQVYRKPELLARRDRMMLVEAAKAE